MDSQKPDPALPDEDDDNNSLETTDDGVIDTTSSSHNKTPEAVVKKGAAKSIFQRFNFFIVMFIFILLIAGVIIALAYFQSKKAQSNTTIKSQNLSSSSLQQVASSDATVGDPKTVLNVQSNAVFAGKVLVRSSLEVAGDIQLGGTLTLNNITVSGIGTFASLQASKNFSAAGDAAIQGQVAIGKDLAVTGSGNFNGSLTAPQITTSSFQLNGDLTLTHHINAGGPQPTRTVGTALGSGGTTSVSGSDTSGNVSINIGSGASSGCFTTINFAAKFNSTPHVIITPIGSDAALIDYYVNRSTAGFSICDATAPAAGLSFSFDYFVVD